ncbi:adrA protein [Salmonella bongori]|nr:adrA protein [Salmonella bongori]
MFPKIMNDENFYRKAVERAVAPPASQNEQQRSGLRFARRIRLPRAVGLGGMFLPVAAVLVSQPLGGGWWLLLVGWTFVWPHLAWQLAAKARDPLSREIYNLKADAILAGMWIALMGVNLLPAAALLMMMCMNLMGAGGPRLFFAGMALLWASCLVTLQLTGLPVATRSSSLEVTLSLPVIVLYPLLFAWVSYQTAIKLAEHKRRLQAMSSRDGMTGVYNRQHWEILLRDEFDHCRRHHREATLLIIDIDHFKSINDTWGMMLGMRRLSL